MAFAHSPKIVTDGLVLALDAGNPKSYASGSTTWRDKSGNGNDGTLTNGPTFSSDNGGAIMFDGANDYVNLSASTSLWTSSFSVGFFIKLNTLGNQFLFSNGGYGSAANNFWFGGGTTTNFAIHLRKTDGTGAIGYNYSLPVPYTSLGYYSIVYNTADNTLKLYQNSDLVESKSTSLVDPSWMDNGWRIGNSSGAYNVNGDLYNFTTYNRALSASEVQQNYNALKGRFGL